jgi:phosphoribosylanthranilate isomerase
MAGRVRVKICGLTNLDDVLAAVDAGADALGFNFYAPSPRYIAPQRAAEMVARVPASVWTVGVFVDEACERVAQIAATTGLTVLQFHGHESPEYCAGWPGKTVIKALRVRDRSAAEVARTFGVDFILADAYVEGRLGGTGAPVETELLAGIDPDRLILAGGLTPENVAVAVRTLRPFGVDVASGVEDAPGRKDWSLMKRFIANAHAA